MNLHELGVQQGTIISCDGEFLNDELKGLLEKSRAIIGEREKPVKPEDALLVLSQDCDLARGSDNYVEVLPMRAISEKKSDPRRQRSRDYRKLQLSYEGKLWLLESDKIAVIRKDKLPLTMEESLPVLDWRNLQLVIDWRVARYNRKPLPDRFNKAFVSYLRDDVELSAYLEDNRDTIFDLYVHIDPMDDENADEYRVVAVALIDQECSDEKEQEIYETLKRHWDILHKQDNCLKMAQIDDSYAPESIDINSQITAKLADFTFLDNHLLTKVTLEFLCYDDPV